MLAFDWTVWKEKTKMFLSLVYKKKKKKHIKTHKNTKKKNLFIYLFIFIFEENVFKSLVCTRE